MWLLLGIVGAALLPAGTAAAQNYPEKPVTMIAPFPAGGSVDLVARAVAQHMSEDWKQPVIVANRPGAGGNIGAEAAGSSPAELAWFLRDEMAKWGKVVKAAGIRAE